MSSSELLKRKIKSSQDLQSVVKTMKALAAVSIHQYEKAVESLTDYNRTVEMGIQILLQQGKGLISRNQKSSGLGLVIFGSDQGMCGQFNEQIVNFAHKSEQIIPQKTAIIAVGLRVLNSLDDYDLTADKYLGLPSSVNAITPLVQNILLELEKWRCEKQINRIVLYYNELVRSSTYNPKRLQILPLDSLWLNKLKSKSWQTKNIPTFKSKPNVLFSSLIEEYLFISLYRACANSLASENASRLAAMQVAEKNIGDRLEELNTEYQLDRQTTITSELLDIISGFEALNSK
jgi:F-type H+-transporting ATPase subunit gamma